MSCFKIENLDCLFFRQLGKEKKIVETKISKLTPPGEHYGSLILKVDLVVQNIKNKQCEEIHSVIKTLTPNETIQGIFNIPNTFKNEIQFYETIFPTLEEFQRENGIEPHIFAAKLYGARVSLSGCNVVDQDAALALENLIHEGFQCWDKVKGFDYDTTLFLLKELALLHATAIALKLKKPEVFEGKIINSLVYPFNPDHIKEGNLITNTLNKVLPAALEQDDECKDHIERIMNAIGFSPPGPLREPFATISHGDFWTTNTMIKFKTGKAIENRILDFQICQYLSAANDVIFFLFSSVQNHVLVPNIDSFLEHYHKNFIKRLEEFNCDITEFNYDGFLKECELSSKESQFNHCVFMLMPILAEKGTVDDKSKLDPEKIFEEKPLNQKQREKLYIIIKEFIKRNWI